MGEYQTVRVSLEDRAAIITIDHPPVNAFNSQVIADLNAAFDEATANEQVKVIIVTGAGQFFVAGADINEIKELKEDQEALLQFGKKGHNLFFKIERSKKPVIAAINGRACLGGGNEMAMACHIRLAEDSVQFGQPEIKLGIMPGWGGTQRLPRLVGKGRALELILGGGNIKAQEAYRIGLVNKVVPVGSVVREATRWAKVLSTWSAVSTAAIITSVNEGLEEEDIEKAMEIEMLQFASLQASEDMAEGLAAFLEKRRPKFQDK
ncbi:MAG TPA: enoyl-CoA hydratase-related protein [Anaerolineae bacterium]|nr:enoyl-CoA hydratase-related protein [Anaerolineae bacterium]